VLLDVLPAFDHDTDGYVVKEVVAVLSALDHALVDDSSRGAFRAYVAARMTSQKKRLGWQAKPGENDGDTIARPVVLRFLGEVARDPATLREADVLAKRWLADPTSIDADLAPVAIQDASIQGDGARWDQLRVVAKDAKTPFDRIVALGGLGAFDDPKVLGRTFDLVLTDEVKMQDMRYVFGRRHELTLFQRPDAARAFFAWLSGHWEAARAKLPGGHAGQYVYVLDGACSAPERDAELSFLQPHMADVEGSARPLAESVERVTECAELRSHGAEDVARYFGAKGHKG
jgi:hypothetical protein